MKRVHCLYIFCIIAFTFAIPGLDALYAVAAGQQPGPGPVVGLDHLAHQPLAVVVTTAADVQTNSGVYLSRCGVESLDAQTGVQDAGVINLHQLSDCGVLVVQSFSPLYAPLTVTDTAALSGLAVLPPSTAPEVASPTLMPASPQQSLAVVPAGFGYGPRPLLFLSLGVRSPARPATPHQAYHFNTLQILRC